MDSMPRTRMLVPSSMAKADPKLPIAPTETSTNEPKQDEKEEEIWWPCVIV